MGKRSPQRWCFPAQALLDQFEEGTWANQIADQLGVKRSTVQRWRGTPTFFDPYQADRFAIRIGKHPSEIWHNWFELPELNPQQRQRILNPKANTPCQHTNVTASVTTSSAKNTAAGATTSPQSTSTSSSANTTKRKPKPSSNTGTPTATSSKTQASKHSST